MSVNERLRGLLPESGVGVLVLVGVDVGVFMSVDVGVCVGVDVAVEVGVSAGVGVSVEDCPALTQLELPESVKVCPAIGTNSQS